LALKLDLDRGVPFTTIVVTYLGRSVSVPNVLVDTGSVATVLSTGFAAHIGIVPKPDDVVRAMRGVGGIETVFERQVDGVAVGEAAVTGTVIQVAGMDYGIPMNAILGMDVLRRIGAIIDLGELELRMQDPPSP
jgi:predicted aspartyl protease